MDTQIYIPNANPVTEMAICRRCLQYFIPKKQAKKGSAQYYRCNKCLTLRALANDYVNSCSVS